MGEYDRAIADYTMAVTIDPKDIFAYNNRGLIYLEKNDFSRAIVDCGLAIAIDPKDPVAYNNRGIAHKNIGDYDRAIADLDKAISHDPLYSGAYSDRGATYAAKGEFGKSIADHNMAISLDHKSYANYMGLGVTYFEIDDFKRASANFQRAAELKNDIYPILFHHLSLARTGEASLGEFEKHLAQLNDREKWPYPVAELFLGKKMPNELLSAATNDGQKCEAQFHIGEWLLLNGKPTEAKTSLESAGSTCQKFFVEYSWAISELKRLKP